MTYKVFLVEDEVTTREGIRDNVDWQAMGFDLCGEAPDGEIAMPQIEALQPDVLITDIKMPFMDGLQLSKIIREHMAWMKIIIISGYNDFQYAQTAIQLGVTEYLLKPVSLQDLQAVLTKISLTLDQEKSERAYLKRLRSQVEDNLALLREKFLLRLVLGAESSLSAIEQSQQLGLNILAPYYQVILLELKPTASDSPLSYAVCQAMEKQIASLIGANFEALVTKKAIDQFVLIVKGENLAQVREDSAFLITLLQEEINQDARCSLLVGVGAPQQRLGELHRSYTEALVSMKGTQEEIEAGSFRKLDHSALRRYLESGQSADFDAFYDRVIRPLTDLAIRSPLLRYYVFLDIVLSIAQYISDLGGNVSQILPVDANDDNNWADVKTAAQIHLETQRLFSAALAFRDSQVNSNRTSTIQQAKAYIADHFQDAELSLNEVAVQVNFSPNHFSAVFRSETGETFRDYLTRKRLEQAKKLLTTTRLKCAEVAFQCGYNDAHYFSILFRKNCGMTPQQYRDSTRT